MATPPNKPDDKIAGIPSGVSPQHPLAAIVAAQEDFSKKAVRTWMSVLQPTVDKMTRDMVMQWIAEDKRTHVQPDGTSACGRYYDHLGERAGAPTKSTTQWMAKMIPAWQRSMMLGNKYFQDFMRSDFMVHQFELIDRIIRESYPDDHGTLYKEQYNHRFLTETSTNEIVAVDDDAIVALFKKPSVETEKAADIYPRLLLTSSHARGESLSDVTSITHGCEGLARDSREGKQLNHGHIDKGVKPAQTLTLYACDVEKTPCLNAAQLLKRLLELKKIARTGKPDRFEHISPGAKRIAKLMLKCMVEQPERIDTKDPRHVRDAVGVGAAPLVLREDAIEIANHFQLIGYSKGGNVVSDAMRYLVSELAATNDNGTTVFQTHPASSSHAVHGSDMNVRSIHDIVRGISMMALASIEVEMAQHYKDCGVRRVSFNNQHDLVSAHDNYRSAVFDERYLIEGVLEGAGHDPRHMMGTRGDAMQERIIGYAHNDGKVTRRLREFFAPNYADAAIGHIYFDTAAAQKGSFAIEAASGTTDTQLAQYLGKIKEALVKQHLFGVTITNDPQKPAIFNVCCAPKDSPIDFTTDSGAMNKLRAAFSDLRDDIKNPVVTMRIENEIDAFARQKGMHGFDEEKPAKKAKKVEATKPQRAPWGKSKKDPDPDSAIGKLTR